METARTKWKFPELHNLEIGNRSGEEDEADILHDEIDVEKVGDSVGLATNTTISVNNTGNDQEEIGSSTKTVNSNKLVATEFVGEMISLR